MMRRIEIKLASTFLLAVLALGFSLPTRGQSGPPTPLSGFALGALPNPVGEGFTTTITGVVFGNGQITPDGQIDFFISGDPTDCNYYLTDIGTGSVDSSGAAMVSFYASYSGTISICGNYTSGESGYAAATAGPFVLTVYAPTTLLVYVPGASVPGANITFNVVLTLPSGQTAPTGSITLEDPNNGNAVVGGPTQVGSITVNGQSVNGATITTNQLTGNQYLAVYSGDGNYSPESASGTIFLENPLTSVTPSSFVAGATVPSSSYCQAGDLQVTLTGIGFDTSTTAQILINGNFQSLQLVGSTTTQLTGCIPAAALTTPSTLQIETNTYGQNTTGGPVAFQVYAPFSINTTVASIPSTFSYGSNLASIISGTGTRTAATDAAVPAGTVTFDLTGTSPVTPTVTLGTAQFTQSTTTAGTYQSPLMAQFDTNSTQKMISADLNGDGYADVVGMPGTYFGDPAASPYLQIFLSTGANSFQSEQQVYTGCAAQDFAVGDIDGDNVPDLVVVCPGVSTPGFSNPLQAYYMHGNGDGTFGAPVIFGTGSYVSSPTQVVIGWFNNDGYNDIAVIDGVDGYLQIISPIPNTYDNYVYFDAYDYGSVFSAGAADFNQDGLTDIVLGEYSYYNGGGAVLPLINSGSGNSFNALSPSQFNATTYGIWSMAVTDLNGDGYPDVAIADPGIVNGNDTGNVLTFENDQSGDLPLSNTYPLNYVGAVAGPPFPIVGQPSNAAVAPGWNLVYSAYGTSDNDIFVGELQRQDATTWTQVGNPVDTGTYPYGTEGGPEPGFIVAGDMNGDGYLDFAASGFIYDDGAPSGSLEELVPYYYGNDAQVTFNNATELPPPGTYSLSMLYPGNQLYQLNNSASTTITITQATPTISWTPPAAITYGTALSATQLDATASVPGTFDYSPALGAVLTAGTQEISVTFTPTDGVDYSTASIMVPITVLQATPTVSWTNPSAINYGTALGGAQLDATASVPGTFAYNPGPGTVLAAGTQPLSATFTPTDTADYVSGEVANASIVVNQSSTTVTWNNPAAITYGTALSGTQLNATASAPGTFSYNPAASTVLAAGVHTLDVTFTPTDTADYQSSTGSVSITVNQATPTVTWGAPAAINYGTALSATQLDATASAPGTFTYNPAVTTLLTAGTHTLGVTFTPTDAVDYQSVTKFVSITVNQVASTVSWTAPAAITYGTALSATQLDATGSVPGVLTYTPAAGTVLTAGTQTLSVTFAPTDSVDYAGSTGSVSITVNKATPTVTWAAPAGITYGTALSAVQLNATASVPGVLTYTPAAGTVLTAGTQTLSVTFSPTDGTDYKAVTKTAAIVVGQASVTINWTAPAAISYGTALGATQLNATASVPGTFVYNPVAGTVLTVGVHALGVTFTPTDATDYAGQTVGTIITVIAAAPTVTWANPAAINYGTALGGTQLDATASVPGTFAYNPVAGTVLTAGTHSLGVTFTPTDNTDYSSVTANASIVVNQGSSTVTWNAPAAITYGTAIGATQLDATATPTGGTFAYNPPAGTTLPAGAGTLSVTYTPTDTTDYATTTASVTIQVNKATPAITWTTPAAINYGTPLSATQLDASSTVAGTFAYTPAAGAVLNPGTQTLSVTLTPTDGVDYKTATHTVSLTVNAPPTSYTAPTENVGTQSGVVTAGILLPGSFTLGSISVVTQGAPNLDFNLASGGTCTAGTAYTAGQTCTVNFTFKPTAPGNRMGAILLYDNASPTPVVQATILLSGIGVGPETVFLPAVQSTLGGQGTLKNPDGVAVDGSGDVYVADVTNNAVYEVPYGCASSACVETIGGGFDAPVGVAVDGAGNVLVADAINNAIKEIPPGCASSSCVTTLGAGINNPADVAVDVNENVYSATFTNPGTVYEIPAGCQSSACEIVLGGGFNEPDSLAVDASGNVFVSDGGNNAVKMIPAGCASSACVLTLGGGFSGPSGVAVDGSGNTVYVADGGNDLIKEMPVDCTSESCVTTVGGVFSSPSNIAVDSSGNLYVPDYNNGVVYEMGLATPPPLTFATTAVGSASSDSPQTVTLANIGNAPLTLSVPASGDNPNISANFTLNSSVTLACPLLTPSSSSGTLAAGASCLLPVSFTPTAAGPLAGSLALTDNNLNATNATQTISLNGTGVVGTSSSLASSPNPATFGQSVTFTATVAATSGASNPTGSVQFSVDGTAVASILFNGVSANGSTASYTISTLTAGTHIVTVAYIPTTGSSFSASSALPLSQFVNQTTTTITWPTPAAIIYGTKLSATQLNATASVPGTLAYTPAAGTYLTAGTHTLSVTFTPTDNTDYTGSTSSVSITVHQATPTITWGAPAAINYGTALSGTQLNATASVPGALSYSPALGTVLTAGTHTLAVTFTPTDGVDYKVASASQSITVNQVGSSVTWNAPAAINYGTPLSAAQLNATSSVPGTFAYNPAAGTVLTAGAHQLAVTFTPTDSVDYKGSSAAVNITVNQVTPTITWGAPGAINYGTALSAAQLDATASVPGTFTYSPASGTVLAAGSHQLSVTFAPTDGTDYSTATAVATIVVNQATSTVTWNAPSAITYGTALSATQLNATSSVPGTFVYNPVLGTVLKAGAHTLGVTFTPTDATDYQGSTASVSIQVNQATPTITWPTPSAVPFGTQLSATQLDATASTAGTLTYTPPAGTSLTGGSHTLSVSFTPTDATDYTTATGSVIIQVTQATPVITWPSPGNMSYGTPLGATQLDATATPTGGTFTYNPPAGTTLPIGTQTLSVSYVPTDTTDYTTATATTTVNVIAGLTLTSVVPNSAPYGSAATPIVLTGVGFTTNSVVKLNGTAIATTYTSPTQLAAQIPASFFQQLATGTITVVDTVRNLTTTSLTFTVTLPNVSATFSGPGTAGPGEQPTLNLALSQPYPIAIQGNMTLTVDPLKTGGQVDPAVQFATGGTTFNFTIAAGSTTTPNVQIQTGTVGSTITVTLTLQANGQDVQPPSSVVVTVPDVAPVITSATLTRSGDTLTVTIQGYSSTRDMSQATFDFTAAPGSSISNPELNVDVTTDFTTWYSSDTSVQFGSSFTYSQIFNLSNDASTIGSVSVTLTNSIGQSNEVTAH